MQSEVFPGDYLQRQYFEADDFDGVGGFYSYDFPAPANYELPPPPAILDSFCGSSASSSFELRRRFETTSSGVTDTFPDEKTLVALRNHKEAEKRRRERINSHLDRLRSLLPCSSKTDKATLLAKVVQRVRELNHEASEIVKSGENDGVLMTIPSEKDEFSVHADVDDPLGENNSEDLIMRASLCCEDRSDLFSDLTGVLNSLHLKTLKAEICTLGGRARNVLVVSGDRCRGEQNAAFLHDALKGIVQRSGGSGDRLKRRRRMEPQLA